MFFASGQEMMVDMVKVIAQTAFSQGTTGIFQEYEAEAMPHIFLWICAGSPQSEKWLYHCTDFCKAIRQGKVVAFRAVLGEAKGLHERELDVSRLTPFTADDVCSMMREAVKGIRSFSGSRKGNAML